MVVQAVHISSATSSRLKLPPSQLTSAVLSQCSSQKHVWLSVSCSWLKEKVSYLAQRSSAGSRDTSHTACSGMAWQGYLLYSVTPLHDTNLNVTPHGRWLLRTSDQQHLLIRIALKLVNKCGSNKNKFICCYKHSVTGIIIPRLFAKNAVPNFKKIRERV